MPKRVKRTAVLGLLLAPWPALYGQDVLYETSVRPVLVENCLGCHNEKLKLSGLSLASRKSALAGGKRGPAAVPGKPDESRLLQAVNHRGDLRMPPGRMLEQSAIATLEGWIRAGMVWPDSPDTQPPPRPNHWSFLPPKRSVEPAVKNQAWVRGPIDRFILAKLEQENIQPSPEASAGTLVRRVYLDLTGLPPAPEEVAAFIADKKSGAWERLVERLLASPHYGERWGRFWLDQARYADSDAGSRDEPRQIWKYRDWVIDAMNRDLPFDRFVVEQLAGDLLPNPSDGQLTATGFHRNSPIQIEAGTDREQYRVEAVFDRVDTTGTVFLGLSVGCARCHNHKFDPVSHREYYQLLAFFNNSDDWGEGRPRFDVRLGNLHEVHGPLLEFAAPETLTQRDKLRARMKEIDREIDAYRKERNPEPDDAFIKERNAEIQRIKKSLPAIPSTMIMRELPEPRQTHIFLGGDYTRPGDRIRQGTPAFLHPFPQRANANRLDFASWLVDPSNPLLARVTVNRIWQQYFGRGIVETENDFGTQGTPPTHPKLLDWLATEFVSGGWSQKAIHRLIVSSAVYRQASEVRKDLREKDPSNLLLARQTRLRVDSEIVRDVTLAASGLLNNKVGGPSVFPPQPASAMTASQIAKSWTASTGPDRYRRGMYTFFWRLTPHPALAVFDSPNSMTTCTRRTRSNTPLQALALLNETAFHEAAQALGVRLMRDAASDNDRLRRLFQLCLSREPKAAETERLRRLLALERDELQTRPEDGRQLIGPNAPADVDPTELAVWTALARVTLNLDEFITRE